MRAIQIVAGLIIQWSIERHFEITAHELAIRHCISNNALDDVIQRGSNWVGI
jgi:hypothetical protein